MLSNGLANAKQMLSECLTNAKQDFSQQAEEINSKPVISTAKQMLSNGLTNAKQMLRENRIEENRIEEISIDKSSSSSSNNNILYNSNAEKLQEIMIETIGTTNINNIKECLDYLDKLPLELIEYALRKTARIKNPSWQYTIPILESYITKKFKTVEQAISDDLNHKNVQKVDGNQETKEEKIKRKIREVEEGLKKNETQ